MSVQFGMWNFDGKPLDETHLERVYPLLAPYGPDRSASYSTDRISIHYFAFHTTKESRQEDQPHISASGAVITWDGRLDNRKDLISALSDVVSANSSDTAIVAAALEEWGPGALAKLIGDWALSLWKPSNRSLLLAKDFVGTRHLYYSVRAGQITWSTILDPLVRLTDTSPALNEEYLAGCLAFLPAAHLTPYVGIHSVPPCCYVHLREQNQSIRKYWDFDGNKRIRYRTDQEYEEQFRQVFADSVARRLRSDAPVLAELSGGMDSSSIVCMADLLIARGPGIQCLNTFSYYDDAEPAWDDRPYFTIVEEKRGRVGCHIDVGSQESFKFEVENSCSAVSPTLGRFSSEFHRLFAAAMNSQGNRVVLSGIGGDEVTGGVPTPIPELENLLAKAQLKQLAQQLRAWALNKRVPWFHLLREAARGFLPSPFVGVSPDKRPLPWLHRNFVKRHRRALSGYQGRLKLWGPLPSFQDNVSTLEGLRSQMACNALPCPPYEKRYPYLDRDLLEFLFAVPREQIVRPGNRRSLMRRALTGIVPAELLNRKRKAYVVRAPVAAISRDWVRLTEISQHMVSAALGIVLTKEFSDALQKARQGMEIPIVGLMRTLAVEAWLRALRTRGFLPGCVSA